MAVVGLWTLDCWTLDLIEQVLGFQFFTKPVNRVLYAMKRVPCGERTGLVKMTSLEARQVSEY